MCIRDSFSPSSAISATSAGKARARASAAVSYTHLDVYKRQGLGDAVCLNDPITGQGSNNAAKAAAVYLKRILDCLLYKSRCV